MQQETVDSNGADSGTRGNADSRDPQLSAESDRGFFQRLRRILRREYLAEHTPPTYYITRWFFLRLVGLVHLVAFASFWTQLDGLIGSNGIAPARMLLERAAARVGDDRFWRLPTLCWINASDTFLHLLCGAGVACAILFIVGIAPPLTAFLLFVFYLSLVTVTPDFLGFQWDSLLLETTFLAIFFAPTQWLPKLAKEQVHSRIILFMLRWLLFRLMFSSGIVKLGDSTWRELRALDFHYETQPLPHALSWFAHQLPQAFQSFSTGAVLAIEIALPFFILAPRRVRAAVCAVFIVFQILIALTGNYTFFNLLAIALCLLLLDDRHWRAILPKRLGVRFLLPEAPNWLPRYRRFAFAAVSLPIVFISGSMMAQFLPRYTGLPDPVYRVASLMYPFHVVSTYGLFANMTTNRPEIVIEGSNDGTNWKPYEFRWKPGRLDRAPGWVQPFQPRLDWQMWFAALRPSRPPAWFYNLEYRLLQGNPETLGLLESNPFPDSPPKEIRSILYDYSFTDFETLKNEGRWWDRKLIRMYTPPITLPPDAEF